MIENPSEFQNGKPMKPICVSPSKGDLIYLYLSISQARYLLDQLDQSLKTVNCYNDNLHGEIDLTEIVATFPKETDNDY